MTKGYRVRFRDSLTGEERWTKHDNEFSDGSVYYWMEGNMGCGCNRQSQWHYADPNYNAAEWTERGDNDYHPTLGALHGDCDDTRFRALYAALPDGTVVVLDGE